MLVKVVLKIIIIRSLTCTTAGMIESVVTLAPANVQQTKALVLKCCRVGWTHWLLVRRAVVITNTTRIKCRESFADGMVIASNVCARVYIFRAKKKQQEQNQHLYEYQIDLTSYILWERNCVLIFLNFALFFLWRKFMAKKIGNRELLFLQKRLKKKRHFL